MPARLFAWLMLALLPGLAVGELRLYTEEAPPTSFLRDGEPDGYAVDLVRELSRRTGSDAHIELIPWTRGYYLARHEPDVGLFMVVRTPERESVFQWVGPILQGTTRFYSLKDSGLRIESLEAARRAGTLALPKQWYTYETLERMGFTNLHGVASPRLMVSMLKHGRVKLIATEDLSLREELAGGGLTPDEVQGHMVFMQSDYYIAFSARTAPGRVMRWQRELEAMRRDGSLERIRQRWLPRAERF
ncbi:substrate-binding periplasmic protein [Pseudomonas paralcaligenes]|uniref:substrate-binding periplasmic protein n=1 Tax=Pseudomonas paralcaligenes TaxID=2772558 RepID=UPI001C8064EB|nr:transporter substrate-binding domain-containing protein [Pseudomonas paralcaligenes]